MSSSKKGRTTESVFIIESDSDDEPVPLTIAAPIAAPKKKRGAPLGPPLGAQIFIVDDDEEEDEAERKRLQQQQQQKQAERIRKEEEDRIRRQKQQQEQDERDRIFLAPMLISRPTTEDDKAKTAKMKLFFIAQDKAKNERYELQQQQKQAEEAERIRKEKEIEDEAFNVDSPPEELKNRARLRKGKKKEQQQQQQQQQQEEAEAKEAERIRKEKEQQQQQQQEAEAEEVVAFQDDFADIDFSQGHDEKNYNCANADDLQRDYDANCDDDLYSKECNNFLLKKEIIERSCLEEEDDDVKLYPNLNDENFNIKIAEKEEFSNLKYDGTIHDVEDRAAELAQQKFGTSPHQQFVKTFFSSQTPYNSLLLYHGLGSGKTCSAIGVCEEFRDSLINTGKPILVVADSLLQAGFKKQLFDESKLIEVSGIWNINSCVGDKLLREINPMNFSGLKKVDIVSKINLLINNNYEFLGYEELYNILYKIMVLSQNKTFGLDKRDNIRRNRISEKFSDRLIVIDEVHNVTDTGTKQKKNNDKKGKKGKKARKKIIGQKEKNAASAISWIIKYAENIKLLMLTATPMYNSYKEIRWLLNIMNKNDKRSIISKNDIIFNDDNQLDKESEEIIIRKSTGYVSVVRGENPYTFPYKIFPEIFSPSNTFSDENNVIPSVDMFGKVIPNKSKMKGLLPIFLSKIASCVNNKCNNCQSCIYRHIIDKLVIRGGGESDNEDESLKDALVASVNKGDDASGDDIGDEEVEDSDVEEEEEEEEEDEIDRKATLGEIRLPLNALVMTYPNPDPKNPHTNYNTLTGDDGFDSVMEETETNDTYRYKSSRFRLFKKDIIKTYSSKIYNVLESIQEEGKEMSKGVILIYAPLIKAAIIPMALALEEFGFKNRHQNLLTGVDIERNKGTYTIIKGDVKADQRNEDINELTKKENSNGEIIKVVIISMTGAEGIDLKFIRQVHILGPWYNMSRNEQIIGRAVRQFSHQLLPFDERNVQIFMYGMINTERESADLYLYRHCEKKAIRIGEVSRVLKQNAIDCILNHEQTQFTQKNMKAIKEQKLSTGLTIQFEIGDVDNSSTCDYKECDYECNKKKETDTDNNMDTFNVSFITININKILDIIRILMRQQFFYKRDTLIDLINSATTFPLIQIYSALNKLVDDDTEFIIDKYGRKGRLVNIDDYYLYQPEELNYPNVSTFDRSVPIDYKRKMLPIEFQEAAVVEEEEDIVEDIIEAGVEPITKYLTYEPDKIEEIQKVFKFMSDKKIIITEDEKQKLTVHRLIERLDFKKKSEILKYYLKEGRRNVDRNVDDYFKNKIVGDYIMLHDVNNLDEYVMKYFTKEGKEVIESMAHPKFNNSLKLIYKVEKFPTRFPETKNANEVKKNRDARTEVANKFLPQFGDYVGYIGYKKQDFVFKTKNHADIFTINSSGATCGEGETNPKKKNNNVYTKLNIVINKINPATQITVEKTSKAEGKLTMKELCIMLEFLLRLCQLRKVENKIWFLPPELAIYFDLYNK